MAGSSSKMKGSKNLRSKASSRIYFARAFLSSENSFCTLLMNIFIAAIMVPDFDCSWIGGGVIRLFCFDFLCFGFELGYVGLLNRGEGADLVFAVLVKSLCTGLLGSDGACVLSSMAP